MVWSELGGCPHHSSLITHHSFLSCRYGDALDNRKLDFGQRFRDVDGDCFSRVVAGQYESMFNSRQMLSMNLLGALAALLCVPLLSYDLVSGRFSLRSPQRVLFSLSVTLLIFFVLFETLIGLFVTDHPGPCAHKPHTLCQTLVPHPLSHPLLHYFATPYCHALCRTLWLTLHRTRALCHALPSACRRED